MWSKARLVTLIPVRDMNRAVRFYTKVLGGKLVYRGRGEMKNFWASLKLGGADLWLVNPPDRERRTLAYQTFLVKDIVSAVIELKKKGVKFQPAQKGNKDTRVQGPILVEPFGSSAFFKDSEGNLMMVWQNNPAM